MIRLKIFLLRNILKNKKQRSNSHTHMFLFAPITYKSIKSYSGHTATKEDKTASYSGHTATYSGHTAINAILNNFVYTWTHYNRIKKIKEKASNSIKQRRNITQRRKLSLETCHKIYTKQIFKQKPRLNIKKQNKKKMKQENQFFWRLFCIAWKKTLKKQARVCRLSAPYLR